MLARRFLLTLWLLCSLASCAQQQAVAIRLAPGQDLKAELLALASQRGWGAACIVTCVGSLQQARLRLADASEGTTIKEKLEIVSLVGTFSKDGGHFHISVSDGTGKTTGGHLLDGNLIYTTAEIVILPLPHYRFDRVLDERTGFPELAPTQVR